MKVRLGRNDDGRALNPFDDLLLRTLRQAKFGPGENFGVFPQNWRRNIEPELCFQREPKNVRLQSAPRENSGNHHIRIQNHPKHTVAHAERCRFACRCVLTSRSISRAVKVSVPPASASLHAASSQPGAGAMASA